MDEEVGVRMTRLRRRLSEEHREDVSSPSTPTKKRPGKLSKIALDNIAENALLESPKRATRRSMATENAGGDEPAVGTPGRKTRGKVDAGNLSENVQGVDTPRAMRVTRRNSLAGSDADAAVLTPVRRSRRLSRDGCSPDISAEVKLPAKRSKRVSAVTPEVILEEGDKEKNESNNSPNKESSPFNKTSMATNIITVDEESGHASSPGSIRKSPRLSLKKNTSVVIGDSSDPIVTQNKPSGEENNKYSDSLHVSASDSIIVSLWEPDKSMSPVVALPLISFKREKKRSKSFTILEPESKNDSTVYCSDNESRKYHSSKKIPQVASKLESKEIGDHRNASTASNLKQHDTPFKMEENKENVIQDSSIIQNKSQDISHNKSCTNISGIDVLEMSNQKGNDNVKSETVKRYSLPTAQSGRIAEITSIIFMEDSDGNNEKCKSEEQNNDFRVSNINDSCEPMDVDESVPACDEKTSEKNLSQSTTLNKENSVETIATNNRSVVISQVDRSKTCKESEVKLEIMLSVDTADVNDGKNIFNKGNNIKSNSFHVSMNIDPTDKYLTTNASNSATNSPRQVLQKTGVFTSTPVRTNETNDAFLEERSRKENTEDEIDNSAVEESENSPTREECSGKHKLLDDKAESAGDNYKSGDSQDESERRYAKQNEIPTKGETLDSDEDIDSDDSDYEKDSFIVSSNEEDDELLSGSGEDLSESDRELNMTSRSKEKYNNRKTKEQKQASREMFEARHGITNKSVATDDSDDPEIMINTKNKKRNRLRLDSSKDTSDANMCDEQEISMLANNSKIGKDPLMNAFPIKQEVMDISKVNHTAFEDIENVDIAQDVTIFTHQNIKNPLQSDTESSDSDSSDGGIANNYSSLLKDLNNSKDKNYSRNTSQSSEKLSSIDHKGPVKQKSLKSSLSLSEDKESEYKKDNSLFDELNVTASKKEEKIAKDLLKDRILITSAEKLNTKKKRSSDALNKNETILNDLSLYGEKDLDDSIKTSKKKNLSHTENTQDAFKKEYSNSGKLNLSNSLDKKNKSLHIGDESELNTKKKSFSDSLKKKETILNDLSLLGEKHPDDSIKIFKKKNLSRIESTQDTSKKEYSKSGKLNLSNSVKDKNTSLHIGDESSSDTIDFKLLFTKEDSNDLFIPLKKVKAKTDLLEYTEVNEDESNELIILSKKGTGRTNLFGHTEVNKDDNSELVIPLKKSKAKTNLLEYTEVSKSKDGVSNITEQVEEENYGAKNADALIVRQAPQHRGKSRKSKKTDDFQVNNNKVYVTRPENVLKIQRLPQNIIDSLEDRPQSAPKAKNVPKIQPLPQNIIDGLEHKPKKTKATATSHFDVQTVVTTKTKPSRYLEESVHIDRSPKHSEGSRNVLKNAKVLPSLPCVSTSNVGCTSSFKVNVIKRDIRHDEKLPGTTEINFKTQRLYGSGIKRVAIEELCRKQKKIKISKY